MSRRECYNCCMYNYENIDYAQCEELITPFASAACCSVAILVLADCQRQCPPDPGILTIGVP